MKYRLYVEEYTEIHNNLTIAALANKPTSHLTLPKQSSAAIEECPASLPKRTCKPNKIPLRQYKLTTFIKQKIFSELKT